MRGIAAAGVSLALMLIPGWAFSAPPKPPAREGTPGHAVKVTWQPAESRPGDVALVVVAGTGPRGVKGEVLGQGLSFFPHGGRIAALVPIDMETAPKRYPWRVTVSTGKAARTVTGHLTVLPREFPVERLTLPPEKVDLSPEDARRAEEEARRWRSVHGNVTPERLWKGRFMRPVSAEMSGEGFGARRVINDKPRSPHSGADYAVPLGTPVLAANAGRVVLVDEFFFHGRFVVIDHGLGLYTSYLHLDRAAVHEGDMVTRGQTIGTVGATGRATGAHLHFGVQVGSARVDPASLLAVRLPD